MDLEDWVLVGVLDAAGCFMFVGSGDSPARAGSALAELLHEADRSAVAASWLALLVTDRELVTGSAGRQREGGAIVLDLQKSNALQALSLRLTALVGADAGAVLVEARQLAGTATSGANESRSARNAPAGGSREGLRTRQSELQAVLMALPDFYFRFDAEGRFIDYSAPSQTELFVPPEVFLGKAPHEVMPPELAGKMERARAVVHASGALCTVEYELEVGGARNQYEARYVPFLHGQTMAIVRNVTELHRAERVLKASEARLRDSHKVEAVGRLAGGVAHDFNNLLMVISGYTSVISRYVTPGHPAAKAVEELATATQRGTALTKPLLALSRRQPPQPTVLDLGEVLPELHGLLARVLGESIELGTDIAPDVPRVRMDRAGLEQVILNLALNARDAMPRGGKLLIGARPAVWGDGTQQAAEIRVTDTGSGMDGDIRAQLFEPFFTTKLHGTGLGLYMVRAITEQNGGRVEVSTQLGAGTSVALLLPADSGTPLPARPLQELAIPSGTESILVVEDEGAVRRLLLDQLRRLGYDAHALGDATSALEWLEARAQPIHLLLTDIVMPGLSGWELARRVKSLSPACRVLYISGHVLDWGADEQERVTPGNLLEKPFTLEALAASVRASLDATE